MLLHLLGGEGPGDGLYDLVGGGGVGVDPTQQTRSAAAVGPQLRRQLSLQLRDVDRRPLKDLILLKKFFDNKCASECTEL